MELASTLNASPRMLDIEIFEGPKYEGIGLLQYRPARANAPSMRACATQRSTLGASWPLGGQEEACKSVIYKRPGGGHG